MRKEKTSFSMLMEPKLYKKMNTEAKRLEISKVRLVSFALTELFKTKSLELKIK